MIKGKGHPSDAAFVALLQAITIAIKPEQITQGCSFTVIGKAHTQVDGTVILPRGEGNQSGVQGRRIGVAV